MRKNKYKLVKCGRTIGRWSNKREVYAWIAEYNRQHTLASGSYRSNHPDCLPYQNYGHEFSVVKVGGTK